MEATMKGDVHWQATGPSSRKFSLMSMENCFEDVGYFRSS